MKIIVCIKQVPDTSEVRINPETNTLIREGVPSIINPYDLHAIEAALQIKDQDPASTVTALTMGPPHAEVALRDAIALGVDDAALLTDRAFAGSDTWATAYALAKAAEKIGFDMIFCGKQAIDGDTAQVGPEMAEFLNIPHIAYVKKIEKIETGKITVHRLMDDGYDVLESSLPLLMTVVKELNTPRLPSIKGKMRAKKIEIRKWTRQDIGAEDSLTGLNGSPTRVSNIFAPVIKKERKTITGTPDEMAAQILDELKALHCIQPG
ncbi:MAG: electron transfer flavoprotein subunit beta [Candidatus Lindowbacteria bacterium RIFCSPLOWO2_12_FULL_62_27]|nr:MAG: electron transfer flavoprotein subunit beta [Candidatus Lindowbacteria bacterium RIFCSPLOWO2_02_FULL_62_12]OGH60725.1 MAG: electron transfer flavoprotein subunit beta [Candidatus Lindowbacteria bacterium RIFCSPLOWO2_12_FULL_62_27]